MANHQEYNGMDKNIVMKLYIFSCWFDKELNINGLKTVKCFREKYPKANEYFEKYLKKKICNMNNDNSLRQATRTFKMVTNNCFVYDFSRHLRNSFAHGHIEKSEMNFIIPDNNGKRETSFGYLRFDEVMHFITIIEDNYI